MNDFARAFSASFLQPARNSFSSRQLSSIGGSHFRHFLLQLSSQVGFYSFLGNSAFALRGMAFSLHFLRIGFRIGFPLLYFSLGLSHVRLIEYILLLFSLRISLNSWPLQYIAIVSIVSFLSSRYFRGCIGIFIAWLYFTAVFSSSLLSSEASWLFQLIHDFSSYSFFRFHFIIYTRWFLLSYYIARVFYAFFAFFQFSE